MIYSYVPTFRRNLLSSTVRKKAAGSSERVPIYQTAPQHVPDSNLQVKEIFISWTYYIAGEMIQGKSSSAIWDFLVLWYAIQILRWGCGPNGSVSFELPGGSLLGLGDFGSNFKRRTSPRGRCRIYPAPLFHGHNVTYFHLWGFWDYSHMNTWITCGI
jgi:hypothetical protein